MGQYIARPKPPPPPADLGHLGYTHTHIHTLNPRTHLITITTMPLTRDEAVGFQVDSADTWLDFKKRVHKLKPQGDYDCDLEILACGVCGSDVHTLCGGWGDQHYPLVVGHGKLALARLFLFSLFFFFFFSSFGLFADAQNQRSSERSSASAPR